MMTKKRPYETAVTLVYDPVAANRNATRASLHSLGFRNVDLAPSLDIFEERLGKEMPDLVLAEAAGAEAEVCRLIQSLRQGALGINPFTIAIVTTWRRDGNIVGQVVNSGADDLVARPFSTTVLGERIKVQVVRRKPFVVTADYIGPDRRRDPRGSSSAATMDVPNTLQVRTHDLAHDETERLIASQLARAKGLLNAEKLKRDAVYLLCQWRMLEGRSPKTQEFGDMLARLQTVGTGIARRARASREHRVSQHCESLAGAADAISVRLASQAGQGGDPASELKPLLHLVGESVAALAAILAPGESVPASMGMGHAGAHAEPRQAAG
jgi:DNA-binding response OmpR family regulator